MYDKIHYKLKKKRKKNNETSSKVFLNLFRQNKKVNAYI